MSIVPCGMKSLSSYSFDSRCSGLLSKLSPIVLEYISYRDPTRAADSFLLTPRMYLRGLSPIPSLNGSPSSSKEYRSSFIYGRSALWSVIGRLLYRMCHTAIVEMKENLGDVILPEFQKDPKPSLDRPDNFWSDIGHFLKQFMLEFVANSRSDIGAFLVELLDAYTALGEFEERILEDQHEITEQKTTTQELLEDFQKRMLADRLTVLRHTVAPDNLPQNARIHTETEVSEEEITPEKSEVFSPVREWLKTLPPTAKINICRGRAGTKHQASVAMLLEDRFWREDVTRCEEVAEGLSRKAFHRVERIIRYLNDYLWDVKDKLVVA